MSKFIKVGLVEGITSVESLWDGVIIIVKIQDIHIKLKMSCPKIRIGDTIRLSEYDVIAYDCGMYGHKRLAGYKNK